MQLVRSKLSHYYILGLSDLIAYYYILGQSDLVGTICFPRP